VRRRQRSRSHFGGYRLSGQFRLNPATTGWHGNDSSTPFMMDIKFYRFWIVMNTSNICLMVFIILTRISDDFMPVASVFLIPSVMLLIYSSALRGKFELADYELEKRWKKDLKSRNFRIMNILISLLFATSFVLAAIIIGRATDISDLNSIIVGIFSCFILQSVRDVHFLVEHSRKPKPQFPPLDHFNH
jgi:hypothetical protein